MIDKEPVALTRPETRRPDSGLTRRDILSLAVGLVAAAAPGAAAPAGRFAQRGGTGATAVSKEIEAFRVAIPQAALDNLKLRLATTRWPDRELVVDWSQGVPLAQLQKLVAHWHDSHDWRKVEARLNTWPQFRTTLEGLGIHFIHVQSKHPQALAIVLTHGWPGSVLEFLDTIPALTDPTAHGGQPEDTFHVVIPSLPGFGFSDRPLTLGWDVPRTAQAWAQLMQRLGYTRWVAQGGDWGTGVTHALGRMRPAGLVAAHVNWPLVFPETLPSIATAEERRAIDAAARFGSDGNAYFLQQATRPQTVAYGLADSPVGQAAWIYEKIQAWSDNNGNPEDALSLDAILDDISLYWLTNTAASSARYYWENARTGGTSFSGGRIELPMAATIFPREIYRAPRRWAEALWPNLIYWNEVDRGGHFAAWEQPMLFVNELRRAFRTVR